MKVQLSGIVLSCAIAAVTAQADARDVADLRARPLVIPIETVRPSDLSDSFREARDRTREHEALDILAPRNTAIHAVEDGTIEKLFTSKLGGLTIYQFDPTTTYAYYYAHLEGYAPGLRERTAVARGRLSDTSGRRETVRPRRPICTSRSSS